MKKIAIVLSGCGVYDGAEIHESTMAMLAVKRNGADYRLFAPDINQHHVINHLTGETSNEQRNVLVESARIARGNIKPLSEFDAQEFDALLFPGGFGVAKNLCDFAFKGADYQAIPEVANVIKSMHASRKPIGAMCISPVLLAKVLDNVSITLGDRNDAAIAAEKVGATHVECGHGQTCIDKTNKVVSTPCYMLDADITQIFDGADKLVKDMLNLL